ncbi:hypothetical protein [Rheinheimera sp.]|uniref:hypothetical protein n=1 Tax=Rheinheimera sp. TaxID=1869214 RepID=UPI00307D6B56
MPFVPLISAITGFFASMFMAVWNKLIRWYLTGGLKIFLIYVAACTVFYNLISWLVSQINGALGDLLYGVQVPDYAHPIMAALPSNTGACIQICLATYLAGAAYNLSKEVARFKLRMTEKAAGFSKA